MEGNIKSDNIASPDRLATRCFIYFFSSSFPYPSLPPSIICSLPLHTRKDQISWRVLFVLYPLNNGRWSILIRQSPLSAGNGTCQLGTRQDGCHRAGLVEAHCSTCSSLNCAWNEERYFSCLVTLLFLRETYCAEPTASGKPLTWWRVCTLLGDTWVLVML